MTHLLPFLVIFLSTSPSIADIPGPPPQNGCDDKQAGEGCTYGSWDRYPGICQMGGEKLVCANAMNSAENRDTENINHKEATPDALKMPAANDAIKNNNTDPAQGCTNLTGFQANLLSLLSILFGLVLLKKLRKS
jgi:hypothetical protein